MRPTCLLMATAAIAAACAAPTGTNSRPTMANASDADLKREVTETERAFARTMADRDHAAFTRFLSEEAVFFSGAVPLRGRHAVASHWARFYEKPQAPFSWEPDQVEVLDSGNLALSSGPVRDPHGKLIARFTSIWRREAPGTWRIVFDKGNDVCE
jgi:ketosteroid isomerase-like protein